MWLLRLLSWIPRHIAKLLGLLTLVPVLIRGLKGLVGLGGDADFLISRSQDPGWLGTVINTIIDLPAWATLPLMAIGLGLIWLDSRRPWASKPVLRVEFDGRVQHSAIANQNPFVQTSYIGEEGELPINQLITQVAFCFGVRNGGSRTVRNVRAECVRIWGGGWPAASNLKIALPHVEGIGPADIQPGLLEYFRLSEFLQLDRWMGLNAKRRTISREEADTLRLVLQPDIHVAGPPVGGGVPTLEKGWPIGRPWDDKGAAISIDVAIYGDDVPPHFARFEAKGRRETNMALVAQGLKLPKLGKS